MLRTLFPPNVVTVTATPDMWDSPLYPEEATMVERASIKRKREFAAGRRCAREALSQLGITDYPLLVGENREPLWPSGVIGSLSHCDDFCGVAVTRSGSIIGLGLDVEPVESLGEDVITLVCTPAEICWLQSRKNLENCLWPKLIFSAKESVYKCYYPLIKYLFDFKDVELAIDPDSRRFTARFVNVKAGILSDTHLLEGRFDCNETHIFTTVTLCVPEC